MMKKVIRKNNVYELYLIGLRTKESLHFSIYFLARILLICRDRFTNNIQLKWYQVMAQVQVVPMELYEQTTNVKVWKCYKRIYINFYFLLKHSKYSIIAVLFCRIKTFHQRSLILPLPWGVKHPCSFRW